MLIPRPTGFRLAAALEFYAGFTPGCGMAAAGASEGELTLAFSLDVSYAPVAVTIREVGDDLVVDHTAADATVLRRQLARMLGLDVDGAAWRAVGERDPVIGKLQRTFAGFFTAAKASPYDAATWAVIAPRMPMQRAAAIKLAIARAHGDTVGGHRVFPGPARLVELTAVEGLSEEKVARLRGIGEAALRGRLDATHLLELGERRALDELQQLRGVGPWAASHIYYRGASPIDGWPTAEPRVLHGLGLAYDLAKPTEDDYARISRTWRPFGMWVTILLMRLLAQSDRWHAPGLARERVAAGRHARFR